MSTGSHTTFIQTKAEGDAKRDELFVKNPTCMHCGEQIERVQLAVAVWFVQREAWKLTHRKDCAFEAMFAERPMFSKNGPAGRTMPGLAKSREADREAGSEEREKAFLMVHTPAELRAQTIELFQESPICFHCNERVKAPDHATALLRNRDQRWLLVHHGRCSIDTVAEENQRRAVAV